MYGQERLYAQASGGAKLWYATDALGSVRQTLDNSGAVLGSVAYDPWGQVQQGSVPTFGFTGELQQGASVYLRARWYNSQRGTFTSRDSFAGFSTQPYSLMPYQYGYSNPVLNRDPSGKCFGFLAGVDTALCIEAALWGLAGLGVGLATKQAIDNCGGPNCFVGLAPAANFDTTGGGAPVASAPHGQPRPYTPLPGIAPEIPQMGVNVGPGTSIVDPGFCTVESFPLRGGPIQLPLPFPLPEEQGRVRLAADSGGIVKPYTSADLPATKQFVEDAIAKYTTEKYGDESFGRNYWENLVPLISADRPDNYLIYKVGDKVTGAMLLADRENDLRITFLQGLGDGAGTNLVKSAVLASIARGFGGRITLDATDYAVRTRFYENRGFVLEPGSNSSISRYVLDEAAAERLLQK